MIDPFIDTSIRHQIFTEGLKADRSNKFLDSVNELSTELQKRLSVVDYDNLGDMTKAKLAVLLLDLQKIAGTVFNTWLNSLISWLQDYIDVDRSFWQHGYATLIAQREEDEPDKRSNSALAAIFAKAPRPQSIWSKARNDPMGANGMLPEVFLRGFATVAQARIANAVRQAFANNETKADAIKALIGTPEAKHADGLLATLARQGQAASNTVIQHVAATTNSAVATQEFAQYLWVSVLDSHTTVICRDRNGNVYTYGEGPEPPAHVGCRSSIIGYDGTGPVTMPSFTVWAHGQSQEFMNAAFDGETPSAYQGQAKAIDLEQFAANRSLIIA